MGMFVTAEDRVPIAESGEIDPSQITDDMDVIWIYPVMSYGVQQRVIGRATQVTAAKQKGKRKGRKAADNVDMAMDFGVYQIALLEMNVLAWEGPSFRDKAGEAIPCTPDRVRALNTRMPLVAKVIAEIGERNAEPDTDDDEGDEALAASENEGDEARIITLPKRAAAR